MAEVQVIGGGFSGLTAAYFLMCRGHKVRVVEKNARLGGLLDTITTPYGIVETAANALLANALVERTARELRVELTPALPTSRRRYIFRDGRLRRWPLSLTATLRVVGLAIPIRFSKKTSPLTPRPRETVREWGERALGAEATRFLISPALAGIYAGNPGELSASLTVGKLFAARRGPRRARGKLKGSVAPLQGMGAWAPAFRRALELNGATFAKEPLPGVPTVVAIPPPAAAEFLKERAPALAAELRKIEMVSLVSVTLFFAPETAAIPGFGCLFPRGQKFRALGVLANDKIFPGRSRDSVSETWLLGGAEDPDVLKLSDSDILQLVQNERARLHGLRARLLYSRVTRWEKAVPHYTVALEEAAEHLHAMEDREGLYRVFGTYLGELGLATLFRRAEKLAQEFP